MGAGMLMYPLKCIITYSACVWFFGEMCPIGDVLLTAANLTAFYFMLIHITYAFFILLGDKIDTKSWYFKLSTICMVLFPIPTWYAALFAAPDTCTTIFSTMNVIMSAQVMATVIFIQRYYKHAKEIIDDYYSEDMKIQIDWVSDCVWIIGFAFLAGAIILVPATYTMSMGLFVAVGFLITATYIFHGYYTMMLSIIEVKTIKNSAPFEEVIPQEVNDKLITLSSDVQRNLHKNINIWIENRGYAEKGITIQSVAHAVFSNRTYLSAYIHSVYKCSFKVLITRLRVDEAKRMMCEPRNLTMNDIATATGFSSTSSFIHVFKNCEKVPPAKWRAENKQLQFTEPHIDAEPTPENE